jgi:hypothetical protein
LGADDITRAWGLRSAQWLAWARTPGQDVWFTELNLPWCGRSIQTKSIVSPLRTTVSVPGVASK